MSLLTKYEVQSKEKMFECLDHVEDDVMHILQDETPEKPHKPKRRRLSVGGVPKAEDWSRCREGFDGLDLKRNLNQYSNTKRRNSSKKQLFTEFETTTGAPSQSGSQPGIDSFSSDEEELGTVAQNNRTKSEIKPVNMAFKKSKTWKKSQIKRTLTRKSCPMLKRQGSFEDCPDLDLLPIEMDSPLSKQLAGSISVIDSPVRDQADPKVEPNKNSQDQLITDYGSDIEDGLPDKLTNQVHSESPLISAVSSTSESPENAANIQKGSDWLKNIQLKMVTPEKANDESNSPEDSAKKKKPRYIKEGLAEKLQKLSTREKSNITVWKHKKPIEEKGKGKTLHVKVLKMKTEWSMIVAKCERFSLPDNTDSPEEGLEEANKLTVLFSKSQVKELSLKIGSSVNICPPWRSVHVNSLGEVVLCTYFCQFITQDTTVDHTEDQTEITTHAATWCCPCKQGRAMAPSSCPAQVHPCPTWPAPQLVSHSATLCDSPDTTLHTVELSQASVDSQLMSSILDSVERRGGCTAVNLAFHALIQRIYCRKQTTQQGLSLRKGQFSQALSRGSSLKWYALCEDVYGGFCQVQLPEGSEQRQTWSDIITSGEGCMVKWSGLRIQHRLIRTRAPGLFTMIDSVWCPDKLTKRKPDSQDSEECLVDCMQPPGFCYTMLSVSGESRCELLSSPQDALYCKPSHTTLMQWATSQSPRLCAQARVIYQKLEGNQNHAWFITDSSIQSVKASKCDFASYIMVSVRESSILSADVTQELSQPCPVLLLKDICKEDGRYYVDSYSRVSICRGQDGADKIEGTSGTAGWLDMVRELRGITVHLPALSSLEVCKDNLFSLTGMITGVDEDTAYSWMECDKCGSDRLSGGDTASMFMYCGTCSCNVTSPVTRIQLEVYLQTKYLPTECKIKVKLLQPTIEKLLPEQADEEGYELQCVLGKTVGPIQCHLLDVRRNITHVVHELYLQEIILS